MKTVAFFASTLLVAIGLTGCGGGGVSDVNATSNITIKCPNDTSKTAATQDAAYSLCEAPKLQTISPTNSANDVNADTFAGVTVTTDSALDAKSITSDNIKLSIANSNVTGVVTTVGTNGFKFTPSSKLNYVQTYAFTATVKDTLGKMFTINISFTTSPISCNSPQSPNSNGVSCEIPLFADKPILLPDLKAKYDALCGSDVHVQTAIPIDLNKDGKIDLVFTLWCPTKPTGAQYVGSNPNTLIALIQTSSGVFEDKTKDIFGSEIVDLGGVSNGYLSTDLNNDGYDDLILTCMREDGRSQIDIDSSNFKCPTVSFISDGSGHYKKLIFGNSLWNEEVRLIRDKDGNKQILLIPNSYNAEIWTFNGQWTYKGKYSWMERTPVFIYSPGRSNPSKVINIFEGGVGVEIWSNTNDNWSREINYSYIKRVQVDAIDASPGSANDAKFKINILTLDGQDYIDYAGIYEGCTLKRTKDSPAEVFYSFLGDPIPDGYTGGVFNYIWRPPVFKLITTGITDKSNIFQPKVLISDRLASNFYHMTCLDLNGDGVDDILVRTDGPPFIYINDGTGKFGRLNPNIIPKEPNGSSHIYLDIDGDGVNDLLYYPIDRWQYGYWQSGANKVQFMIYKGNRAIKQEDLIFNN